MTNRKNRVPTVGGPDTPATRRRQKADARAVGPVRKPQEKIAKPQPVTLASLRREVPEFTAAEKAEERHRLKSIHAGIHPDTGKRLRPGDEKTLSANERRAFELRRDMNTSLYANPYPTATDRILRDRLDQERQRNMALGGGLHHEAASRAMADGATRLPLDPLADSAGVRDRLQQIEQQQTFTDAVIGESAAQTFRDRLAPLARQRRYLDPLLDSAFVLRMTGGLDDDLMQQAMARHEPEALRQVRDRVDSAAVLRMTEHWRVQDPSDWHAGRTSLSSVFARDAASMASEARRMLSIYGPTIAKQPRFLDEYRANLGLFGAGGLTIAAYERADLLARIALPATLASGFAGYDPVSIERVQAYGKSVLQELEADFDRDRNPVHAWEALAVARHYEIALPEWVDDFLADTTDRILEIRNEVAKGKAVRREAERVGQALGFGTGGRGRGGWFGHASQLERDRAIYLEVSERRESGTKLDFAYDEVAKASGTSRSTVVRAYLRIRRLNDATGDPDEGEDEVS